jgi:hypothetical protein
MIKDVLSQAATILHMEPLYSEQLLVTVRDSVLIWNPACHGTKATARRSVTTHDYSPRTAERNGQGS